jgi:hypothetical protein
MHLRNLRSGSGEKRGQIRQQDTYSRSRLDPHRREWVRVNREAAAGVVKKGRTAIGASTKARSAIRNRLILNGALGGLLHTLDVIHRGR